MQRDHCGRLLTVGSRQPVVSLAREFGEFFWLHIPKCGSTFETTLYLWGCPATALIAPNVVALEEASQLSSWQSEMLKRLRNAFTNHPEQDTVWCDAVDRTRVPHQPFDEKYRGKVMTMIRDPGRRIVSAFTNHLHAFGLGKERTEAMHQKVDAILAADKNGKGQLEAIQTFQNWPGVQGCSVKMLTGAGCATNKEPKGGYRWKQRVINATNRLLDLSQTAFFGITDLYNVSICLFHAMLGGDLWDVELHNVHPTTNRTQTNSADQLRELPVEPGGPPLWDFEDYNISDPFDQQLYDAAVPVFNQRILQNRAYMDSCCVVRKCTAYMDLVVQQQTSMG